MTAQVKLGDMHVDVVLKDIKNIHLSVHPPAGRVRISAPARMKLDAIRVFAISKLGWIREQQRRLRSQERETRREYLPAESHYVWGRRHLLRVTEGAEHQSVVLTPRRLHLLVPGEAGTTKRETILDAWYRQQVKTAAVAIVAKWEPIVRVNVQRIFVQRMKTRWGSCNQTAGNIRLNTELAKKPLECLEYIVVHEMLHLLEPTHNARFIALLDKALPQWPVSRRRLNELPVRHEDWAY